MEKNKDWKGVGIEEFDTVRQFVDRYDVFPNNTCYYSSEAYGYIIYDTLFKKLIDDGAEILFSAKSYSDKTEITRKMYLLYKNNFILFDNISSKESADFDNADFDQKYVKIASMVVVLHKENSIDSDLHAIIASTKISTIKTTSVAIISRDNNGYYLQDITIDTPVCDELDLHYGEGFQKFHDKLLNKRLLNKSKGISLLNGKPGTGKTYYINRLIYDLNQATNKKRIILVPSNMISHILEPEFNSFLLEIVNSFHNFDYVDEDETDTYQEGLILILEDAESILMKREMSGNSQGTSNILNLTDGLLNSIFKVQIIATYNTSDANIDDAILRDKRLLAKRTFSELSLDDTLTLVNHLGFDNSDISKGMTLAQIYSIQDKEDDDILIESKSKNKNKKNTESYL